MNIEKLKINGFANLENKNVELSNGFNLVLGNNEKGKSTLLKFIQSMLYGLSKNKIDKNYTELQKYEPWFANNYSGKIEYILDDGKKYSIYRDFYSKDFQVMDENNIDITNQYGIDKSKGTTCFYEQTDIDEGLFCDTTLVEQNKSKLDEKEQSQLIQKITNLISTGKNNISYKKIVDKLNQKLIEQVGNDRTVERPINIINEKIKNLQAEKNKINSADNNENNFKNELNKLEKNIKYESDKLIFLKQIKTHIENRQLEYQKIQENVKTQKDYAEKINNLMQKSKIKSQQKNSLKVNSLKYFILFLLIFMVFSFAFYLKHTSFMLLIASVTILPIASYLFETSKINKQKLSIISDINALDFQKNEYQNAILSLNESNRKIEQNIDNTDKLSFYNLNKFNDKITEDELQNLLNMSINEINIEIFDQEQDVLKAKVELQSFKLNETKINENTETLNKINSELDELNLEKERLISLQDSILLAKEVLEIAYKKVRENITPKLQEKLISSVHDVSSGKYKNVFFSEEDGLSVEIENGKIIPVSLLSAGTIDQMYLCLRLNVLSDVVAEKIPFILDEPFAFYDDKRIENTLNYLNNHYSDRQIIIFSCSNREHEIFNKIGLKYNLIEI